MIGVPTREKEIGGGEISWECHADTCTSTFHTVNVIPRTCLHLFTCSPVPECVMYMYAYLLQLVNFFFAGG